VLDVPTPHTGTILGEKVAVSTPDGTAYVWRLPYSPDQHPLILEGGGSPHPVDQNMYASKDGQWLLILSADTAFLWQISSDRVLAARTVIGPFEPNAINGSFRAWGRVYFSDTSSWLALTQKQEAPPQKLLWLVHLDWPRPIVRRLPASEDDSFESAVFSQSDEWLATGGDPDLARNIQFTNIKLWDLRAGGWGKSPLILSAHESTIQDLLFADSYLISSARDRSVVKWDLLAEDPSRSYSFLQPASDVRFLQSSTILRSPRRGTILILTPDGEIGQPSSTLRQYFLDPAGLESAILHVVGRVLTMSEMQRYLSH
jgi:WD40 repeat protein